jgi:hypothetical protein
LNLSRRGLLRGVALISGGGALLSASLLASSAAAQTKLSQKAANYQATPKGNAHCNVCTQWEGPADCKTVVGPISPTGWCSLYASKF